MDRTFSEYLKELGRTQDKDGITTTPNGLGYINEHGDTLSWHQMNERIRNAQRELTLVRIKR